MMKRSLRPKFTYEHKPIFPCGFYTLVIQEQHSRVWQHERQHHQLSLSMICINTESQITCKNHIMVKKVINPDLNAHLSAWYYQTVWSLNNFLTHKESIKTILKHSKYMGEHILHCLLATIFSIGLLPVWSGTRLQDWSRNWLKYAWTCVCVYSHIFK